MLIRNGHYGKHHTRYAPIGFVCSTRRPNFRMGSSFQIVGPPAKWVRIFKHTNPVKPAIDFNSPSPYTLTNRVFLIKGFVKCV